MNKRKELNSAFFVFLSIAIVCIIFTNNPLIHFVRGIVELGVSPIQKMFYSGFQFPGKVLNSDLQKLQEKNAELTKKLVEIHETKKENSALKDQFQTTIIRSQSLVAADVVGVSQFIPGVSQLEKIVLNKGEADNVKKGQAVIYKDNFIGIIVKTSKYYSQVDLVTNEKSSFSAKTINTQALGVVKGKGNGEFVLENVVLSDKLQKDDKVVTSGDIQVDGSGIPQGLVIGTVISVDKTPSAIFQTAKIKSLLTISHLDHAFIIVETNP